MDWFQLHSDNLHYVRLDQASHYIEDGDLLLFRRRGLISIAGRGMHSHAAKASWWDNDLFCVEVREFKGGRAVTLESQVRLFPGRIDVLRANRSGRWIEYDRQGAVRYMRQFAGSRYGWYDVIRTAMLHVPLVRLFIRPDTNDTSLTARPPFCSHACALADRIGGGVDPVPHLADHFTEPADLARSPFYEYLFTLLPTPSDAEPHPTKSSDKIVDMERRVKDKT